MLIYKTLKKDRYVFILFFRIRNINVLLTGIFPNVTIDYLLSLHKTGQNENKSITFVTD